MFATATALLILAGAALYLMTAEERAWLAQEVLALARRALRMATVGSPGEPFNDFLIERTRWTVITPLLITLNASVFIFMLFAAGPLDDGQTLANWGGNVALRTTNGEWSRLIASTFVHTGMLHLAATMVGLIPLGFILERTVGPIAFATIYASSGVVASVLSLWTTPATSVHVGASGAICGIYGLLLAVLLWTVISRPEVSVPLITVKRIGAAAAVFFLYNLMTDDLGTTSEVAGLTTGFVSGLVVARGVARGAPPVHRPVSVAAATALIAFLCALPLRGTADVAKEIGQVVAVEERTTGAYDAAVARFRQNRITSDALVRLIDKTIVPELRSVRVHLKGLQGVPREHLPLLTAAEEYFQLREQSWQRRAAGLLQSNTRALREAEETERAALEAFQRMRPAS